MNFFLFALAVAGPISLIFALTKIQDIRAEMAALRHRLTDTEAEIRRLKATRTEPADVQIFDIPTQTLQPVPFPAATRPLPPDVPPNASLSRADVTPPAFTHDVPKPSPPPDQSASAGRRKELERTLSEHWLVWIGGVSIALGGVFLVRYSIEMGLLGPGVRIALAIALGAALIWLGQRLSSPLDSPTIPTQPHVPVVLVGAGSSMIFAGVYAGYALYALFPAALAFAALAACSAGTAVLSLRHGPYVALLGLLGGFLVPALVHGNDPAPLVLFSYLLLLTAGALTILRQKQWWWLAWTSLAGNAFWLLITGLTFRADEGDAPIGAIFLPALFGLFAALHLGISTLPLLAGRATAPGVRRIVLSAAAVVALLAVWWAGVTTESTASLLCVGFLAGVFLALGRHDEKLDALALPAAVTPLLALLLWNPTTSPILFATNANVGAYLAFAALAATGLGVAGFLLLTAAAHPWRWATVSAATPLLVAALAHGQLATAGGEVVWVVGILATGGALLLAAKAIAADRASPGRDGALAAYAVGVLGAIALAAAIALETAWLTAALAVLIPGVAWVNSRLRLDGLRTAALTLAAVVLGRLILNPYLLHYPPQSGVFGWLLYGYGVPALAFFLAARRFCRQADDLLVQVLEGGAALFALLLVSLDIHTSLEHSLLAPSFSLAERSLHSAAWLFGALLLLRHDRPVLQLAGRTLLALGAVGAVIGLALFGNPLLTGESVGSPPLFNLLLLAFALPGLLFGAHALSTTDLLRRTWGMRLALAFAFLWLSLEVRHDFVGATLSHGGAGDAELYTYSLVWMILAAVWLAAGVVRGCAELRWWGLGLLLMAVAKVFFIDMSHLAGIWRALSFLGLGGGLVAIGWLHRRFVAADGHRQGEI